MSAIPNNEIPKAINGGESPCKKKNIELCPQIEVAIPPSKKEGKKMVPTFLDELGSQIEKDFVVSLTFSAGLRLPRGLISVSFGASRMNIHMKHATRNDKMT